VNASTASNDETRFRQRSASCTCPVLKHGPRSLICTQVEGIYSDAYLTRQPGRRKPSPAAEWYSPLMRERA
jgi:hypothetical protein